MSEQENVQVIELEETLADKIPSMLLKLTLIVILSAAIFNAYTCFKYSTNLFQTFSEKPAQQEGNIQITDILINEEVQKDNTEELKKIVQKEP